MTDSNVSPVRTSSPPITSGISICWACISLRRSCRSARSGEPGAYDLTASFCGGGGRKSPGAALTGADCRLTIVSVMRVAYAADGWGEGELWFEGTRLVWHELPRPRPVRTH